jgi:membrane protein DedA with SNARE-associated domain
MELILDFFYQHRYIFAFLGALVEGNNIFIISGFLSKLQLFKFWNILAVLFVGYFINGYALYFIGRFGGRSMLEKWGPRFFLTKDRLEKLEDYFKRHTVKALVITRVTYGISTYVFIIAGIFKTKLRKFFWCNLLASTAWVLVTFTIGYSFGASYELLSKVAKVVAVWVGVIFFIVIMAIAIWLVHKMRLKARIKFIEKTLNNGKWKKLKWFGKKISEFLTKNED